MGEPHEVDHLVERRDAAADRVHRWGRLELLIVGLIATVLLVGGAAYLYFTPRQDAITDLSKRQVCVVLLNAEFDSAVADAFGAPPAPNPARDAAVARLHAVSEKLHHVATVCP